MEREGVDIEENLLDGELEYQEERCQENLIIDFLADDLQTNCIKNEVHKNIPNTDKKQRSVLKP